MACGRGGLRFALFVYFCYVHLFPQTIDVRANAGPDATFNYILVNHKGNKQIAHGHEKLYNSLRAPNMSLPRARLNSIRTRTLNKNNYATHKVKTDNFVVIMGLLLAGDVHPCPGPRTPKHPCIICQRAVIKSSKAISCDSCNNWVHIKCCDFPRQKYDELAKSGSVFNFECQLCLMSHLPFYESTSTHVPNEEPVMPDTTYNPDITRPSQSQPSAFAHFRRKGLHCLHLNVRSLIPKLDELKFIAQKSNAAVIGITETFLDDTINDSEIEIPNYVVERKDRNRDGGGVCVYIRSDIAYNARADLQTTELESIWVDVLLPKSKPILFGVCYRPPEQYNFFNVFEDSLINTERFSDFETIILGDFNANAICKNPKDSIFKAMKHFCYMFDFTQLIRDPTRVTASSETAIDLIFVSDPQKVCQSGVITIGVSDHFMTFCTRKILKGQINRHKTVKLRSMKNYTTDGFITKLSAIDWSLIMSSSNLEYAWSNFKTNFLAVIDDIAPFRSVRVKQRAEPWFDSDLRELIQKRDQTLYKYRKTKDPCMYSEFKKLRNKVQYKTKKAKSCYYANKIGENSDKPKNLWKILKSLGAGKNVLTRSNSVGLGVGDGVSFDKLTVAEKFNNFFVNVASSLVSILPPSTGKYGLDFVRNFYNGKNVTENQFCLSQVDEDVVQNLLKKVNSCKSTGLDKLPAKFIKEAAPVITRPLTHIINLSIKSGQVPDDMKSARVVPIHKKNSKTEAGNYRPVSILSVMSKIIERIMFNQLEGYLKVNSLLYEFQSGFRPSYSTDTCLIHLSDHIRKEWDKGNLTGMVVLDLQKAFDTVNHEIMLGKLKAIGLSNNSVKWFDSYLTNRTQVVDIDGIYSTTKEIKCGVPQGSILGPLLFLIYVNDMVSAVNCKLLLYADDSALMVSHSDVDIIQDRLGKELKNVSDWLIDNKLSLHLGKTESILFGTKRKLGRRSELSITCGDTNIVAKSQIKYLGLDLDQSLTGESTGNKVLKKVNSRLKFIYRKGNYLNMHTKKLLVSSLIQCHYDYGCSVWYRSVNKKIQTKLQTSQNKIIRNVLNLPPRAHIGSKEFHKVNWLPIDLRVAQITINHMFRIINGVCPSYMMDGIIRVKKIHNHATRSGQMALFKPRMGAHGQKTFIYTAITLWNTLPLAVQSEHRKIEFKKMVKTHFLQKVKQDEESIFSI